MKQFRILFILFIVLVSLNPTVIFSYPFDPSPTIGPDGTIYVASRNRGVFAISGISNNSLANTDWPKFRHDIKNTGKLGVITNSINFLKPTLRPTIVWTFNTPDETEFYSSPALAQIDGEWLLFIGATDGYFYAIKALDGSQKWRKRTIFDPTSIPYVPEDVFYASPAINTYFDTAHIYCGGESGELYAYSTTSGSQWLWRYPDSSYDGLTYNVINSSVAISGNRLYVGMNCGFGNDYRLYAIQDDGGTCSEVWSYYTGCEIVSSPAVDASGNIFFGDDSGYVTCLNQNGGLIWRRRISTGIYSVCSSPAIGPNALYVGTDDGFLFALNRSSPGTQIWRYPSTGTGFEGIRSSPVIGSDGTIYFGCDDGKLYAVTSNGQLKSGFPVILSDGFITSTPAIALDGTVIVYTGEDSVFGVSPTGTILWSVDLSVAGIEENREPLSTDRFSLEIYPNPAKSYFVIRCPQMLNQVQHDKMMIKIFDVTGKVVKEIGDCLWQPRNDGMVRVSLKRINPGIYFLQLNNELETKKLVISK